MHHFVMSLARERQEQMLAEARASALAAQVPARRRPGGRARPTWTAALTTWTTTDRPYLRRTA